ncbi:unnamed protein product [Spirodela intermedia]|uniref:Uncharacterized protein n=1 Tax=Spirodela intermedia TaxID=51605 RepID=A0A7I8JNH2_SPIIN|nr:unnamed protein product [Spirodela intermedia]CAA6671640.1 unnamed protein product [Spirodela intermedia]
MNIGSKCALSRCSKLIDRCFSLQSLVSAESVHATLIKVGFHRHTFVGNRLIALYSKLGAVSSCPKLFHDVADKNMYTWNILLAAFSKNGEMERALQLFDSMPERDVITWNSMISGYMAVGLAENAIGILRSMQELGVRPSGFTLSVAASSVSTVHQAKQIHGCAIRRGFTNVVLGNALIDMYGRLRVVGYALGVFFSMREHDIISWNELILSLERSGFMNYSLGFFKSIWHGGLLPDQFTLSTVMNICADQRVMNLGEQIFVLCIKLGYLANSIVSSSIIDMYSHCGRLDCSVRFFMELVERDSAVCNSMISSYARSGSPEDAQRLVMMAMREGLRPTEFTFAIILNTISPFASIHLFTQIHSLVLKSGMEMDAVVASSLLSLYAEWGAIESAVKVFSVVTRRDLICWNSMITGFAENGCGEEALRVFEEMLEVGARPDRITLTGVLKACGLAGLVEEGALVFSSMEKKYGVKPETEHYACMVDMFSRAGMLREAMDLVEMMPRAPWAVELQAISSLPYSVLAHIYGARGRWESMARVWKSMRERGVKKETGCSSIAIRSEVFMFRADQVLYCGGESLYSILRLLETRGTDWP